MSTFNLKITRQITTEESAIVSVEADTLEEAIEKADDAYSEGEYEGRSDIEWDENADAWDAYDHEIEEVKA